MKIEELLESYPSLRGDAEYTEADALADLKEWSESAKAALELVRDSGKAQVCEAGWAWGDHPFKEEATLATACATTSRSSGITP